MLLPGAVIAGQGFDGVGCNFTSGYNQLTAIEIEKTKPANVRIPVWESSCTSKVHYVIYREYLLMKWLDAIVRVCCDLYNLCDGIIVLD